MRHLEEAIVYSQLHSFILESIADVQERYALTDEQMAVLTAELTKLFQTSRGQASSYEVRNVVRKALGPKLGPRVGIDDAAIKDFYHEMVRLGQAPAPKPPAEPKPAPTKPIINPFPFRGVGESLEAKLDSVLFG